MHSVLPNASTKATFGFPGSTSVVHGLREVIALRSCVVIVLWVHHRMIATGEGSINCCCLRVLYFTRGLVVDRLVPLWTSWVQRAPTLRAIWIVSWCIALAGSLWIALFWVLIDLFPGLDVTIFLVLNDELLFCFLWYKFEQNRINLVSNWHYLIEYYVAQFFFMRFFSGLVVEHHIMHVFLVSQRVHQEKLGGHLFQLLILLSIFKLNVLKSFEVLT